MLQTRIVPSKPALILEGKKKYLIVTDIHIGFVIEFFDVLDSAGVESEEISMQEIPISNLREDKYVPFGEKLIDKLNNYKGTYVRAPKMS